jgi:tape measure domain-containing protein
MAIVIQTVSDSAQARRDLTQLKESVQGIQKSSENVGRNFVNMTRAFVIGASVLVTARAFTQMSDAVTNLDNRLISITKTARDATNALAAIQRIAISTRSDLDSTARLYTRLAVASKQMGANQQQVAVVTKAVGQAIKLSGANSVEAANAIQQFAQAMGSGKLQGDEFRAIMEAAPAFAYKIAEGMGVTVNEMYALKEAGLLTNKVVFEAILKKSKEINTEFGRMSVTYGEAFTNVGNAMIMLFGAVKKAFLGTGGGFAITINGWAESIAGFAQNFTFHLLRAQTRAYVFVVDTITMFTDMWDAIKDGAKVLWGILTDFTSFIKPYLGVVAGFFVALAGKIYRGTSNLFFDFTETLKRNDVTRAMGEWLERSNSRLLVIFGKMAEAVSKFDFSAALQRAKAQLIAFYKSLQSIDFSAMGQGILDWFRNFDLTEALQAMRTKLQGLYRNLGKLDLSGFGKSVMTSIKKGFQSIKALNIMDYIPSMSQALDAIGRWAKAVVGWFAWIYDEVIGHSYIPDLVKGVLKYMEMLTGKPLGLVVAFAGAVTAAFSAITFGDPVKTLVGGLKKAMPYILGLGAAAGVVTIAYKYAEENGGVHASLTKLKESFKNVFDSFITKMEELINKVKGFFGNGKGIGSGGLGNLGRKATTVVASARDSYPGFYKMFPEKYQTWVGVGIGAAVVGTILAFFEGGTFRTVLISLATTLVAASMGRGIDKNVIWDSVVGAFEKGLELLDRGVRKIMGTTISKDPFGFLLLVAKTSLLFQAGRDYFLGLAKEIVTAPTRMAQNAVDVGALKL